MEEVDNIIILSLRSIGCNVPDGVQSIKQFSTDVIVEGAATCLTVINEKFNFPKKLPQEMSARFRICTNMANACKELGFNDEIGYHQFLYSNENEVRKLFMWLVERLPRDSSDAAAEPAGASAILNKFIFTELERRIESPWTLPACKKEGLVWYGQKPNRKSHREGTRGVHLLHTNFVEIPTGAGDVTKALSKERKRYYEQVLPFLTAQTDERHDAVPSILEFISCEYTSAREWEDMWSREGIDSGLSEEEFRKRKVQFVKSKVAEHIRSSQLKGDSGSLKGNNEDSFAQFLNSFSDRGGKPGKGTRFTHAEKLQFTQENSSVVVGDSEEELKQKREEDLKALQARLDGINAEIEQMENDIKTFNANIHQLQGTLNSEKALTLVKEERYRNDKGVFDMLPEADKNIELLQGLIQTSTKRLMDLAVKWEAVRQPLVAQYRELKESQDSRMSESKRKLAQIKEFRESMKKIAEETRLKDDLYRQLTAEYEKMAKDINRSIYTRRILEIVKNIKKQKEDIDKVLIDTRAIQKDINIMSEVLNRTFTETDELIFKDAKKDDAARKAYKYLASLHDTCNTLLDNVEETGKLLNEIRDLEDKVEQLNQQNVVQNLERIMGDYQQMKKENHILMSSKTRG